MIPPIHTSTGLRGGLVDLASFAGYSKRYKRQVGAGAILRTFASSNKRQSFCLILPSQEASIHAVKLYLQLKDSLHIRARGRILSKRLS